MVKSDSTTQEVLGLAHFIMGGNFLLYDGLAGLYPSVLRTAFDLKEPPRCCTEESTFLLDGPTWRDSEESGRAFLLDGRAW